jgi:hypothetical protein
LGKGRLQLQETLEETVVLSVGDFRTGLHIVEVIVAPKLGPEGLDLGPGLTRVQGIGRSVEIKTLLIQPRPLKGGGFTKRTLNRNPLE